MPSHQPNAPAHDPTETGGEDLAGTPSHPWDDIGARAAVRAAQLLEAADRGERPAERRHGAKMARLLSEPGGKGFTVSMADEVLRVRGPRRAAERFRALLGKYRGCRGFPAAQRALLKLAGTASRFFPRLVMHRVAARVRGESRGVILPAEDPPFHRFLRARASAGAQVNVNLLGEAVLGEEEAARRLEATVALLADPAVRYVSVKLSSVCSQVHLTAYESTLAVLCERLRTLYSAAVSHGTAQHGAAKFVNLDMEEYRDLHLTVDAFTEVLSEPGFRGLEAGIVLQAYLPDTSAIQRGLTAWATERIEAGGAPIKIRLVKGANLAMEQIDAALHGWPQAPFTSKREVDAHFKQMLAFAAEPENARAVRTGVASHNLFDIALALELRDANGTSDTLGFEMLEGMADAQARAVQDAAGGLVVYAPVVREAQFPNAVAYLVRRLDENTAPQNFLHHLFDLRPGTPAWDGQEERFREACRAAATLDPTVRRTQDRGDENPAAAADDRFSNTPDTDFALVQNRDWLDGVLGRAHVLAAEPAVPLQPSDLTDVGHALDTARAAYPRWEVLGPLGRAAVLREAAATMARRRGETVACLVADASKAVAEADTEVSEAVDFANYYAASLCGPGWYDGSTPAALGVVLVCPPWNFPFAIPAGGCLAALAAGNAVVLKPAPETVVTAWHLANQLWDAGVPRDVLQFVPAPDGDVGKALVTDARVDAVVLTGSHATASRFHSWRPDLRLSAETSGKNAIVVTATADLDLAVNDIVHSAFGHSGQKCSAASLAIVEADVYDDPAFQRQLRDAAASLPVGPSLDPANVITPLVQEPAGELRRALTKLDGGDAWLLRPRQVDGADGRLWSPGVRLGVKPGSWFHQTECFGPVLGLMRADDLSHAIEMQNAPPFGLTAGLHALDPAEKERWSGEVAAGNLYINRSTTGAIVRRQPFGGWKRSAVGPGAKAGGPNYVATFSSWEDSAAPQLVAEPTGVAAAVLDALGAVFTGPAERAYLDAAAGSDAYWWEHTFSRGHDPSGVRGESNVFRYRPRGAVVLRSPVGGGGSNMPITQLALARCALAAAASGAPVELSIPREDRLATAVSRASAWPTTVEGDGELASRIGADGNGPADGLALRLPTPHTPQAPEAAPLSILRAAHGRGVAVFSAPPVANGRIELLPYFREQCVTQTTHRYGNVGETEGTCETEGQRPLAPDTP